MSDFRSPETIRYQQGLYSRRITEDEARGLPPGYIMGFEPAIEDDSVRFTPGIANILGQRVVHDESTWITDMTWRVTKINEAYYTIFLDRYGAWFVDNQSPAVLAGHYGLYHPITGERYLGTIYVDDEGRYTGVTSHKRIRAEDLDANAISAVSIEAGSITADKLASGILNTLIAELAGYLTVDSEGLIAESGNWRALVTESKFAIQQKIDEVWTDRLKMGVSTGGLPARLFYGGGLVGILNDVFSLDIGDAYPSGAKLFTFNSGYTDQLGADPWDSMFGVTIDGDGGKFVGAAVSDGSLDEAYLLDFDAQGMSSDTAFTVCAWRGVPSLPESETTILSLTDTEGWWEYASEAATDYLLYGYGSLAALDSTHVVSIRARTLGGQPRMVLWEFDEGINEWDILTSLPLGPVTWTDIAVLDSSHIAVVMQGLDRLQTFEVVEDPPPGGWVIREVGNHYSFAGGFAFPNVAALDSSTVAVVNRSDYTLRTFSFDGSDWSQVGSSLGGFWGWGSMAALDSITVAVVNDYTPGEHELNVYEFNGSEWYQLTTQTLFRDGQAWIAALDSQTIAYLKERSGGDDAELGVYSYETGSWVSVGTSHDFGPRYYAAMAALDENRVVVIDDTTDTMRTYSRAAANVYLRYDGTGNVELQWTSGVIDETVSLPVDTTEHFLSVHYDGSSTLYLVVNDQVSSALDVSGDDISSHGFYLVLTIPDGHFLDDLLIYPDGALTTDQAVNHYQTELPWAGTDVETDIVLKAEPTGRIVALDEIVARDGIDASGATYLDQTTVDGIATFNTNVNMTDLPTSMVGLPAGALWNDSGTVKIKT